MKKKFSKILGIGLTLALLCSLLLTAAPVSALSVPAVILAAGGAVPADNPAYVISSENIYTVTFTTAAKIPAAGEIVIVFEAYTNITGIVAADVLIESTAGLGGAAITPAQAVFAAGDSGVYPAAQTLTIQPTAGGIIGAGAIVQLTIGGAGGAYVTNPPTVGTYNLTVATQTGATPPVAVEAAVTSADFTITVPTILPLPGVVERYNTAGVLMAQTNSIQTAINAASAGESILVGPGTYDEILTINESVTITGDAATTIIKDVTGGTIVGGPVTISYVGTATTGAVLDGFTIKGNITTPNVLLITGHKVTVQNCIFTKAGAATTAVVQNMIQYAPAALPTLVSTITNCTFDTTLGTLVDNGVLVAAGANAIGLTVSNNTFTVDGAFAAEDSAINTSGAGTALLPITISGNTITGGSGIGVTFTAGTATASDNTLTTLNQAFKVVIGTATIKGNTINACGLAISATAAAGQAAIGVTGAITALSITNNTITNSPNDIIEIAAAADSDNINMMFNNLSDNTKGIDNNGTSAADTLNATHNWWGVATGPATGFNVTAGAVNDTTLYLGGEATGTFTNAAVTSLLTKTTVGVDVTLNAATVAGDIIGVANYAANPQSATPKPAIDGGFYDVYLTEAAGAVTSVLIKFYNANVTANTDVYVWGTLAGGWQPCTTQGVNLYGGYAYVTVTTTTPDIAGLAGTPFALCEVPTTTLATPPDILAPTTGDDTVSLTPTFAWEAVTGADGYYFQLADNANFVTPLVKLDGDLGRLIVTAYAYVTELPYSTAYYWRVKAVSGTVGAGTLKESAWASGVFITMDEPEEPIPPVVVEETPAPIIVIEETPAPIIQPIVEVITPPATPITPAWIYVIIGVGAVLVIALVVLVVRTRRVA